jgi:hypothetical protein
MKTRYLWLTGAAVVLALLISGTAFAEGEVPDVPAATVPDASPAEVPQEPVAEISQEPAAVASDTSPAEVPVAPAVEGPAAAPAETQITTGEAAVVVDEALPPAEPVLVEIPQEQTPIEAASAEPAVIEEAAIAPVEELAVVAEPVVVEEPVLVDAAGEPLVLASVESAEILAAADPYFTSGGTTYSFYQAVGACGGAPNCFDGLSNPIQASIDYIQVNATTPDDGNIYVEKATYSGAVTVNGSLANLNSLTGLVGLPTAGLFPTINGALTLTNLANGFYLAGFNVSGGVTISDSSGKFEVENVSGTLTFDNVNASGSSGDGIHVNHHKGNIVLIDVTSSNNTSDGVFIENPIAGNVTINNSQFNNNGNGCGVNLHAKGIVSIDNVTADKNYTGLDLYAYSSLTVKNSEASNNHTNGIYAGSLGKPVTFETVNANNNGNYGSYEGIYLDNTGAASFKNVTVNSNTDIGMYIYSTSAVTMTGVTAVDNGNNGIQVYLPTNTVTINGAFANNNGLSGIVVESRGFSLRNLITVNNSEYGLSTILTGTSGLIDKAAANNNGSWGIYFDTPDPYPSVVAAITLNNVTADTNFGGIYLKSRGAVTITNSNATNSTGDSGFYIATIGAVKLSNIWAGNNAGNGLKIEGLYTYDGSMNPISMISPASVTINTSAATNNFNGFVNNGLADDEGIGMNGAQIISQRPVVINNFYANNNINDHGLQILGPYLYISGAFTQQRSGAVTITCILPNRRNDANGNMVGVEVYSAGTVTLDGLNTNDNANEGVAVDTLGAIVLKNASDNHNDGGDSISLYNDSGTAYMPITINNLEVNNTQLNWTAALYVVSKGAITINGLNLQDNNCTGAYLSNAVGGRGNISISNANFEKNSESGLYVSSNGGILLTNVNVYDSGLDGATLFNSKAPSIMPISITNSEFSRNGMYGLMASSRGVITLRNVSAHENSSRGIELYNNFTGATAGMSLTNVTAENNNDTGLYFLTNGSATLTTINTNGNAKRYGGISEGHTVQDFFNLKDLDKWVFAAEHDVSYYFLLKADADEALNRAEFNPVIELYDSSDNLIAISPTCFENTSCEFDFRPDDFGLGTDKYYVKVGSDNNNGYYRLSLNDLDPSDSTDAFWVAGTDANALGSITVNGIEAHNNSLVGLWTTIKGSGATTLSGLHISDNGTQGVSISSNTGTITLSSDNFSHWNGYEGVMIFTNGAVSVRKLDANDNGHATSSLGFLIRDDSTPMALSLSNIGVNNNGGGGLWVKSTLGITLTNIDASNNDNNGIYADNCLHAGGVCAGTGNISLNKVYSRINQGAGIMLVSKGNISMTSVVANANRLNGIFLDNCIDDGSSNCAGTGNISLTTGTINNNGSTGLEATSKGSITLNTVEASGNGDGGVSLNNQFNGSTANIILSKVTADNNNNRGISTTSHGSLVMANLDASSNAKLWGYMDIGQTVQDFYNPGKGPDQWGFTAEFGTHYTLLLQADASWPLNRFTFDPEMHLFDENGDEVTTGISIIHGINTYYQIDWDPGVGADGTFYVEVSSPSGSGFYRLSINDGDPGDSTAIFFANGLAYQVDGNVTLTGINTFNDNSVAGLIGDNFGTVSLANASAFGNGTEGLKVVNQSGTGNVTLSGANFSNNNGWEGLRLETSGAVSIANLDSSNNSQDGIYIRANGTGKAVSLLNVTSIGNMMKGLDLISHGITTINNYRGWFNGKDGAFVDTYANNLTVLNSTFMCNGHYGLGYGDYVAPFTFTDIGNIYMCNASGDLVPES